MPRSQLQLRIRTGPRAGAAFICDRSLLIGRDARCLVRLEDPEVSRQHAIIEIEGDLATLRDLGSRNGLYLNDIRLMNDTVLSPGDVIRVGHTVIAVEPAENTPAGGVAAETGSIVRATPVPTEERLAAATPKVLLSADRLARAIEFGASCHSLSGPDSIESWLLPELARLFDSAGALLAVPHRASGDSGQTLFVFGRMEEARRIGSRRLNESGVASGSLPHGRDPGVELQYLTLPIATDREELARVALWRPGPRGYGETDRVLAVAILPVLGSGRLVEVLKDLSRVAAAPPAIPSHLGFLGGSTTLEQLREALRKAAATDATVLLTGESGTGKELAARAIAALSGRRNGPFIALNMAAIPASLAEAELFGYERGAFSGAESMKEGKIELARDGTLFLDEIGELAPDLQAKLLRVLDGQSYYRLGGSTLIRGNARVVCATNRRLDEMVATGDFRADLYHRINILQIALPPLREHIEDLPAITQALLAQVCREHRISKPVRITPRAVAAMLRYEWPGNVRELRNTIERLVLLTDDGVIDEKSLPLMISGGDPNSTDSVAKLQDVTSDAERTEVMRALVETGGHKQRAAAMLGISRPTLDKKIRLYRLEQLVGRRSPG